MVYLERYILFLMLLDIKQVSLYINVKPSTLYSWAEHGKIPAFKIHGLWRFRPEEIDSWLESFRKKAPRPFSVPSKAISSVDALISRAKAEVYNSCHGETRPRSSPRERRQ